MEIKDIYSFAIDSEKMQEENICIADNIIRETKLFVYKVSQLGINIPTIKKCVRIIIVLENRVEILQSNKMSISLGERDICIADPEFDIAIKAVSDNASVILLLRELTETEFEEFKKGKTELPYVAEYLKAKKYTEECKSPKTISRMLVPARIVPRFSMGSVQTSGDDLIEKHAHPMLEQYFISMKENNCSVLVDEVIMPFGGNTLLHIPLGSEHGVKSEKDQVVHYFWLDFLFDESGLKYMDTEHILLDE